MASLDTDNAAAAAAVTCPPLACSLLAMQLLVVSLLVRGVDVLSCGERMVTSEATIGAMRSSAITCRANVVVEAGAAAVSSSHESHCLLFEAIARERRPFEIEYESGAALPLAAPFGGLMSRKRWDLLPWDWDLHVGHER